MIIQSCYFTIELRSQLKFDGQIQISHIHSAFTIPASSFLNIAKIDFFRENQK